MPARPKQQHFVTKAYLDGFLEPDSTQLYCYGRGRPAAFFRATQDLALQRNYYSSKRRDGSWDDSLEQRIQKDIEDPGIAVLRLLAAGNRRLNWLQRDRLCLFVAVQRFRVPHMRQLIDSENESLINFWRSEFDRIEKEIGKEPEEIIAGVASGLRPGKRHETTITKTDVERLAKEHESDPAMFSREYFMKIAAKFAQIFRYMKWTVYYAKAPNSFITSDCPAAMAFGRNDLDVVAIVRADCRIIFPLSRTSVLVMEHDNALMAKLNRIGQGSKARKLLSRSPEIRMANAAPKDVALFNQMHADQASRWIYAGQPNDWLIPRLQRGTTNVRQVVTKISRNVSMVSAVSGK